MGYSVCFYYRSQTILYLTYPNDVVGRFANSRVSQALFGLFGLALTRRRVLELGDLSSGHNLGQVKANLRDSAEEQAVLVKLANCLQKNELLESWCNNRETRTDADSKTNFGRRFIHSLKKYTQGDREPRFPDFIFAMNTVLDNINISI